MPPAPSQIPMLSDTSPSGRRLTWYEALEHNASLLGDVSLYKAFRSRPRKHQEMKTPKMIRAMAEYWGDIEESLDLQRSTNLAARVQGSAPLETRGKSNEAEKAGRQATPLPADPLNEVLLETRFYHSDDGYDFLNRSRNDSNTSGNPAIRDHYTSPSDPNYLIRAIFEWEGVSISSGRTFVTGTIPDSKEIDLLSFMVSSRPLAAFFEQRLDFPMDQPPTLTAKCQILKLAKPFRAIVCNYSRLKDHLTILMKRYGSGRAEHNDADVRAHQSNSQSSSQQNTSITDPSSEDEHVSAFNQKPALEHFQLLVQFIDQYLGEKVALFESYQAGREEMIAFEDLWMLFSSGEKICCPLRENQRRITRPKRKSGTQTSYSYNYSENDNGLDYVTRRRYLPQVYRVMAAGGGALLVPSSKPKTSHVTGDKSNCDPLSQSPSSGGSASRTLPDAPAPQRAQDKFSFLNVFGMYVDFDGAKYGTLMEIFAFEPFDGEMRITSLEAYPLKYFGGAGSSNLLQRGRKFIDVATSPRHMDHGGMTVGETKEEVRFQPCF